MVLILSTVFFIDNLLGFFDQSMEQNTINTTRDTVIIFLVFIMTKAINTVVINGVLRSGADTKFILKLDAGCQWFVGIPLGLLGAFVWQLPLKWVFALIGCEELVKIIICVARMHSRAWMRNLIDSPDVEIDPV
ncbi:Na+ driven multidrug efflux pump [Chitinispirillum alkaliphilum]|nr:Na+ driven multidrug efflux pump [Chitinispirillum alkaliphilum]